MIDDLEKQFPDLEIALLHFFCRQQERLIRLGGYLHLLVS